MTIEEAARQPGTKVQAWAVSPGEDGRVTLAVYEVGPGGAKYLASGKFPQGEVAAKRAELESHGVAPASTTDGADYVWLEHDGGVTVYTLTAVVLEALGDRLTAGERSWPRDAFARIIAYAGKDYVGRGIVAALKTGEEVDLLVETSAAAYADPTYGKSELLADAEWVVYVAVDVSRWAGLGGIERRGI